MNCVKQVFSETGLPALKLFRSCVGPLVRVRMLFPLGAWCPSVGKEKGGVGHQGNRLYSSSTYVLKSIHKRCSAVFLGAAMQAAAENAHSRKATVANSATNLSFYSAQSSGTP